MDFNKKKIPLLLLSVLLTILALGSAYYFVSRQKDSEKPTNEVIDEGEELRKRFSDGEDLTEKEEAKVKSEIRTEGLKTGDASGCALLPEGIERNTCYDNINYAGIVQQGDERACEQLYSPTLKESCYNEVYRLAAVRAKDVSLCQKISNEALMQACKDAVLSLLLATAKSADECNQIQNLTLRASCKDDFVSSSSIKAGNESACNTITDASKKAHCQQTIQHNKQVAQISEERNANIPKTTGEKLVACDSLTGSASQNCKDQANYALAFEQKDLSYCNRIVDGTKRNQCTQEQGDNIDRFYLLNAKATNNPSLCAKINNQSLKELCLSETSAN